jgi:hypothetical protein
MFTAEYLEIDDLQSGYLVSPEYMAPGEWCAIVFNVDMK